MSHQASQPFFTLGAIVAPVVLIARTFFRLVGEKPLTWAAPVVAFFVGVPVLFSRPGGAGFGDVALPNCLI